LAPIPLAAFTPPDVNDGLANQICAKIEAIRGSAGIAFDWHRFASTDAART
jgi:hypothetical protein